MVTIEHLEVRFDVEGGDEEAAFARLFQRYISRWHEAQERERQSRARLDEERSLGDRPARGTP